MDNTLGNLIRNYRTMERITQRTLADMMGITTRSYRAIESGDRLPRFNELCVLYNMLGLSVDAVIEQITE